jgi:glyoxylase-like metal-dependent hydrolase (beta-lactamase superfamily II)
MSKRMRKWMLLLAVVAVALAFSFYWLVIERQLPQAGFEIDIVSLRKLAQSQSGEKPSRVEGVLVGHFRAPHGGVVAGQTFSSIDMPVFVYRLKSATGDIVIDSGLDPATALEGGAESVDAQGQATANEWMAMSSQVLVTHEHHDHLGGLAAHPQLSELVPKLRLTDAQFADVKKTLPAVFPEAVRRQLSLLTYEGALAIAPGVVLVRAPGHTPGSQMVFVQLDNGQEYLFLGDVSWRWEFGAELVPRPRLTALLMGEDTLAVRAQLTALNRAIAENAALSVVPGHDEPRMRSLRERGRIDIVNFGK